ncbi:hypothetical protein V3C40_13495 [Janthinobacterium sp. LS2A]|uniref:hypothetical protein n=1 Tax=Janthinobacterium sp. LS2A TaxID=3118590 RepID=UPI002F93CF11
MFDLPAGQPVASRIGTRFPPPAPFAPCGCALQLKVAVCAANPFKAGLAGLFFACFFCRCAIHRHLSAIRRSAVFARPKSAYLYDQPTSRGDRET